MASSLRLTCDPATRLDSGLSAVDVPLAWSRLDAGRLTPAALAAPCSIRRRLPNHTSYIVVVIKLLRSSLRKLLEQMARQSTKPRLPEEMKLDICFLSGVWPQSRGGLHNFDNCRA